MNTIGLKNRLGKVLSIKKSLLALALGTLVCGCATTREARMAITPEARKASTCSNRLFTDLLTKPGGVADADFRLYPHSNDKTLSRIEVLIPYDNQHEGQERWFVTHKDGTTASYLVHLRPDGRGGTYYIVEAKKPATK